MSANIEFQQVQEWTWLRGFTNLYRKETQIWWRTRRWWVNALLWIGILGGLTANILFVPTFLNLAGHEQITQAGGEIPFLILQGLGLLFEVGSQLLCMGVVALCMDLVIDEKRNGVSEWLLSKPVQRRAYILAKVVAHLAHILLFLVALPAAAVYGLISIRASALYPPLPFLAGLGIMGLNVLFYVTLTILLGVLFNSRAPVLGIAFGSLIGGTIIGSFIEPLLYITPWMLPKISTLIASSQQVPGELLWLPVVFTALGSLVFVLAAVYRFDREAF